MKRRQFSALVASAPLFGNRPAGAAELANADADADAVSGIRVALERGAVAAVALLGRPDGFLANPKVRIPLPGFLNDAAKCFASPGSSSASTGDDANIERYKTRKALDGHYLMIGEEER